jgi:hypothetical protein
MARRDASPLQIIRKDGNGCFVEAMKDAFDIGRIHLRFITYDKSAAQGSKYTNDIDIYIDFEDYFRISYNFMNGTIYKQLLSLKTRQNSWEKELIICQGGKSAKQLAASGKPRQDGMSLARVFKMFAGDKYPIIFKAEMGPGETDKNGLIIPKYGRKPESYVQISMSIDDAKEFFLAIDNSLSAFINYQMYASRYEARIQKLEAENKLMKNILLEMAKSMNINVGNFMQEYDAAIKVADDYGKPKYLLEQNNKPQSNYQQQNNNYQSQNNNYKQQPPQNGYQQQNNYNQQSANNGYNQPQNNGYQQPPQNNGYQQQSQPKKPSDDFMNVPEYYMSENDFFG